MYKVHPLSSFMVVRSLEVKKKTHFTLIKIAKKLLGFKVSYLSVINVFIYLANCIHLDITFSINLLTRYYSTLTEQH